MTTEYAFNLYVLDDEPATQAMADNLCSILEAEYGESMTLECKNLLENDNFEEARKHGLFSIPALVRRSPSPTCRFIGDLNDENAMIFLLRKFDTDSVERVSNTGIVNKTA